MFNNHKFCTFNLEILRMLIKRYNNSVIFSNSGLDDGRHLQF